MGKHKTHARPHEHGPREGKGTFESEVLGGVVLQYNFSPRGGIEGLILGEGERKVQINLPPDAWPALGTSAAIGQSIQLAAVPEPEKHKHQAGEHPVYRFVGLHSSGRPGAEESASVEGVVARFNYARHGEINGVVLEDGDFIHLKPEGMKKLALRIGQRIAAQGQARPLATGHRAIEAEVVDGVVLAPRWLHGRPDEGDPIRPTP